MLGRALFRSRVGVSSVSLLYMDCLASVVAMGGKVITVAGEEVGPTTEPSVVSSL